MNFLCEKWPGGLFGFLLIVTLAVKTVFSAITIHASGSINKLLATGDKGVAARTDFHSDIFFGRTGLNFIPAGTPDGRLVILGMYFLLHAGSTSNQRYHLYLAF
jgi:hypothetical protein